MAQAILAAKDTTVKISAEDVEVGTFSTGMSCATPTSANHLVNKSYVDKLVSDSITSALEASY